MRRPATNAMPRSANAASSAAEVSGDGGTGAENGITSEISQSSGMPRFERWSWSRSAASLGAGNRVELVLLGEPGCRVEVVVRAEGDDEDVGLVGVRVRRHASRLRVDRSDGLAHEVHAGLDDVGIRAGGLLRASCGRTSRRA